MLIPIQWTRFVQSSKTANRGHHARSMHSSKTATALPTTRRIWLENCGRRACTTLNQGRWIPTVLTMQRRFSPNASIRRSARRTETIRKRRMIQLSWGFSDEAWPQPFENSQRMWSYDRTVEIEKPLVTVPWRSIGFYALTGNSVITYKERLVKETIVEALEEIREQNPRGRILLVADNYGSHHAKLTQQRADDLGIEFVFIPPYSPTLNAIEPLWKDLKREISPTIFEDKDHFRGFLTETFLQLSRRLSFAVDWIETFLPDIQVLQ